MSESEIIDDKPNGQPPELAAIPQVPSTQVDPNIMQVGAEIARKVVFAAKAGGPNASGAARGNLAIAIAAVQSATSEELDAAIVQMATPEWRISSQWLTQLSREGKVLALAWLAHVYHQGYTHGQHAR